jgi:ATP-dependent Clp protease ATP-binding subunit ClpA
MYERFTGRARKVMQLANQDAQRFNHEYIGTEHILLGLLKEGNGVGPCALKRLGIDLNTVRRETEKHIHSHLLNSESAMGRLPLTPRAKKALDYAIEEARALFFSYVGTEHILLGLIREAEGIGGTVLLGMGVTLDKMREETKRMTGRINRLGEIGEPKDVQPMPDAMKAGISGIRAAMKGFGEIANCRLTNTNYSLSEDGQILQFSVSGTIQVPQSEDKPVVVEDRKDKT